MESAEAPTQVSAQGGVAITQLRRLRARSEGSASDEHPVIAHLSAAKREEEIEQHEDSQARAYLLQS